MKNLIMVVLIAGCSLIGMEPIGGHKERMPVARASNGSSVAGVSVTSDASTSQFEAIDLKDAKKGTSRLGQGIILVHTQEDLERILQQQEVELAENDTKESKRKSIVYMPRMDLDTITQDLKNPTDEDFKEVCNFLKETLKQHHDIDISRVEKRLARKLKEIHDSPPTSPILGDGQKLQKAQSTVQILRRASVHQATIRSERNQVAKRSPALQRAREPKPLEIIQEIAQDPNVQDNLNILKDIAFQLLNEKLTETQSSKTTTTWVTAGVGALGTIASAVITYLSTRKSC